MGFSAFSYMGAIRASWVFPHLQLDDLQLHAHDLQLHGRKTHPQVDTTFNYMGKSMELKGGEKYYAKKIVHNMFSKEEARKCFNPKESRDLLQECFNV